MKNHFQVIIIGAGQAGLSMSYLLKEEGIDHLVLEKSRTAESWRSQRWDNFCLVTPNWQCDLPGFPYKGNDPFGFMVKKEIIQYIEDYKAFFNPPLHEGVQVHSVTEKGTIFKLETSLGVFTADQVVVAVGNYHYASLPKMSEKFPNDIVQIHSIDYKNAQQIPDGKDVLVVGTGQSGAQIAEDLHLEGKKVHLCVGNAPRTARFYRGRDVVAWLHDMKYYDLPVDNHPDGENVRDKTNHYVTGRDGGRDIDLRKFATEGMQLYGVLEEIKGEDLLLQPNLEKHLDEADRVAENIKRKIDAYIVENNIDAVEEKAYTPVWKPEKEITSINLREKNIGAVIWCIGFGFDFSWVKFPIYNNRGLPVHTRGVTDVSGLYFLGLTWQHTWGSARFSGIGKDAQFLKDQILDHILMKSDLTLRS
jgi:putative flavoprotein involved in K+ transport